MFSSQYHPSHQGGYGGGYPSHQGGYGGGYPSHQGGYGGGYGAAPSKTMCRMPIEPDDPVLGQVYMSDNTRPKEIVWSCEINEALCIALTFAIVDLLVNIFGLAWNGKFFTFDNLQHWFDFSHYAFTNNPIDFLAVAILRICILLGGAAGVYCNPKGGAEACATLANFTFALILVIVAFSPIKLLAFYEHEDLKFAVGDWILMIWCILAALFVQAIWISVFARVREVVFVGRQRLFSNDDEQYFSELQRKESEVADQKRETFVMLFRLFGYMAKEWPFYSVAFIFLFFYSLSRVFVPYFTGQVA
uniref:CX domain-containing protein n=1 Tax=Meloidogyne hapla TaxID=6305 RepID=A0A1I8BD31_MELHA